MPATQRLTTLTLMLAAHASIACAAPAASDDADEQAVEVQQADAVNLPVALDSDEIHQLSGICHMGGDLYLVVADKGSKLGIAKIKIATDTGQISEAKLEQVVELEGGRDLEDLTIDDRNCLLIVTDEADQTLRYNHFPSGKRLTAADAPEYEISVPGVFRQARQNRGIEALFAKFQREHTA